MPNFNKTILIGHLTRDPELRYIASGTAVCEFGLAITEKHKDREETLFIDVTLWGRTAEVCAEYGHKGSPLFVEGKLKLESWEKEGQKRTKIKLVGETIQFLGSPNGGKRREHAEQSQDDSLSF